MNTPLRGSAAWAEEGQLASCDLQVKSVSCRAMCPELLDWIGVGLGAIGASFALVAAVLGIRLRTVAASQTKASQSVPGPGSIIAELDRVIESVRASSWVLLFASLAVILGVLLQIERLLRRC